MNTRPQHEADASLERGFRLGELAVEPAAGDVSGPGGREKLDPKVMDVLAHLARRAGQVVSREELLERLWPGAVVTDDALTRCIYELRRQLSQAGGSEELRALVETLPRRGYRLNGEVEALPPPGVAARTPPRRRLPMAAAAVVAVLAIAIATWRLLGESSVAEASIAVLPFIDMSAERDQAYLGDGISEEILNRLAQSPDLRVIARTSSFSLRDASMDVTSIAEKLDVTHVLEGSVRKSGDRVRVTAQLITGADGAHLWSDTFDRGLEDIFAVQDDIAFAVAAALEVELGGQESVGRAPASYKAWERYRQAELFYWRRAPGDIERALRYYEEAVTLDPRYARAWAALSGAYGYLAWNTEPPSKAL
jgi:TolB-like protein/DNA-binding winged helix-turn-helix (wHTH) protein